MELTEFFNSPPHAYFTGTVSTTSPASGKVVQLGDRWYLLDLKSERYRFASIPAIRPQADTSLEPGEQSLTVEGLWRRVSSSWHHGAGQEWRDRDDAVPTRFHRSRGVDPFRRWQLSLLPATTEVTTNGGGWSSMAVGSVPGVGTRLAVSGPAGKLILVATNGTFSTVAGLTGSVWVTSTGGAIYASDDTGIFTVSGATTVASYNPNVDAAQRIFFGKNRLIALKGNEIYDVPSGGGAVTPATLDYMTGWAWTGATSGQEAFFFSGFAGDKGRIFAVTIKDDATGLNPATVALELPDGEIPYCLVSYVGFVVIGTNLGIRVCSQDGASLTMGPLVGQDPDDPTGHAVRCVEPQDRFVWYGWDDTFDDAAGLGRIDLDAFVAPLAPAYASDLMSAQPGPTTAVATFGNRRWFTTGTGLYRQADTKVTTGFLETGHITFNIIDDKAAVFASVRHSPLETGEKVRVEMGNATAPFSLVGDSDVIASVQPLRQMQVNLGRSNYYDMRVTLSGTGAGPELTGITLASQVAPDRSYNVYLPLILAETVNLDQQDYSMDIAKELTYLMELVASQRLVRFRQGDFTALVFAEDYEWVPTHATTPRENAMNGTLVLKLKSAEITT